MVSGLFWGLGHCSFVSISLTICFVMPFPTSMPFPFWYTGIWPQNLFLQLKASFFEMCPHHQKLITPKSKEAQGQSLWFQEKLLQGQPMKSGLLSPVLQQVLFLILHMQHCYRQPKLPLLTVCKCQAVSLTRAERLLQIPFWLKASDQE